MYSLGGHTVTPKCLNEAQSEVVAILRPRPLSIGDHRNTTSFLMITILVGGNDDVRSVALR